MAIGFLLALAAVLVTVAGAIGWGRAARTARRLRAEVVRLHGRVADYERRIERASGPEWIRLLVEAVPGPAAHVSTDGRYVWVNPGFEEWASRPAAELVGARVADLPGPLAHDRLDEFLAQALSGAAVSFEPAAPRRSVGVPLAVTLVPTDGGALAVIENRAARKRSEATNRAILEAAVDGIVTIDESGRVETFNRAAERIFGYRADEVVGRNVSMLMPQPYRDAHDQYLRNYLSTGEAKIIGIGREVLGLRKDGSTFPMDLAVGEGRVAGRRIFAGIIRDITERKLTAERLRQSEERFRLLVEGVRDYAIMMLDPDGRISSWNVGAERVNGWRAEEIIGRHISCFYPPEDRAAGRPDEALRAAAGQSSFAEEGWLLRKDGSRFWAHVAITPLFDDGGRLRGYVRIDRDMTSHKVAEEALQRAKEEAERANLAKSKFLAAASHDLRQPVQALLFFTSALDRKLRDHPARPVLTDLERSLDALNMLLDSLLDISKLDAGIVAPQPTTFSVASLLDRLESEFAPAARAKGVALRVVSSTASIRSDPSLLNRVVQNLLANAVRYTQRGRILLGCRRRGGNLRIEVHDTGIGIPPDRLDDIFEEFYQVGNQERDRSQGLGLGLAIVQRLVRLLNHRLHVRSQLGRGSWFAVEVPLGNAFPASAPLRRREHAPRAGQLILIIDDEATVLRGLRLILEDWGFEVLAASSEDEAMQLLRDARRQPTAILADYRLRDGHTGTEAIDHIRRLFDRNIPSIIITGDTGPERLREAEASGLSILHKPVQPPQLQSLLNETIGNA